ncbi:metal-dependent hydrolase [Gordonibacter sp. An230]|uniref:M48 family metallopeptidase n=1 Tax=Gordonibacter sp. An230 TaxID=1965592 RepID=UPI000B3ADCBA|nr:SprT family zinc-dependent metalloprotease [Gordonibacter sp. An230]OUO88647.1 metal-dependent hydrolase [Gordonibacter sp. An230]
MRDAEEVRAGGRRGVAVALACGRARSAARKGDRDGLVSVSARVGRGRGAAVAPPEEFEVDGISVTLTRKRVKNINLRVKDASGRVAISAPPHASREAVAAFVRDRRAWIDHARRTLAASPRDRAATAAPDEVAEWRLLVEACVPALVEAWEPIMGVQARKIVYRNMTSRWGSCQPATGRICINVRLALYPPECLEYVVVHELCHLLERGHGPRFQSLMDAFMPDWRERRAKLR